MIGPIGGDGPMLRRALVLTALLTSAALAAPPAVRDVPATVTQVNAEQLQNLPTGRGLADLVGQLRCASDSIPTVAPGIAPGPFRQGQMVQIPGPKPATISCVRPDDIRMIDVYRLHNAARAEVGAAPLLWDRSLALGAAAYSQTMAQTGQFVHSPRTERRYVRENLASVPHGWSTSQAIGRWTAEKRFFTPGVFPNVSRTGDWSAVAHYTQMIWPTTNRLGCSLSYGRGYDWLVCRYSPPGNRDGSVVIPPPPPPPAPPPP